MQIHYCCDRKLQVSILKPDGFRPNTGSIQRSFVPKDPKCIEIIHRSRPNLLVFQVQYFLAGSISAQSSQAVFMINQYIIFTDHVQRYSIYLIIANGPC